MDEKLLRFFKLVGYNDVIAFENAHLKDMVINKRENTWTLRINAKSIINLTSILNLKKLCIDGVDDVKHIYIEMNYEELAADSILEYFIHFLEEIINESPSLSGIDKDKIRVDDDVIIVEVASKIEETTLKRECKKIMNKMMELKKQGKTMVFVSHSAPAVKFLCDRSIWLSNGEIKLDGKTSTVLEEYLKECGE